MNVIAPYVLTALMLKPARLVYLSSSMHRGGSTDLSRLGSGAASYSDTKLWVTALSQAFAFRWPDTVRPLRRSWLGADADGWLGGPSMTSPRAGVRNSGWRRRPRSCQ